LGEKRANRALEQSIGCFGVRFLALCPRKRLKELVYFLRFFGYNRLDKSGFVGIPVGKENRKTVLN
jgi:hypothetical protein